VWTDKTPSGKNCVDNVNRCCASGFKSYKDAVDHKRDRSRVKLPYEENLTVCETDEIGTQILFPFDESKKDGAGRLRELEQGTWRNIRGQVERAQKYRTNDPCATELRKIGALTRKWPSMK